MALCLATIVTVTGCGLLPKRSPDVRPVPLAQVPDEIVKLERSFSADGEAVSRGYDHPHAFSQQAMGDEVAALLVRRHKWGKYGMGSEWVSKPAFTAAAAERLVPALVMAFKEASPSDTILFHAAGQTGQPTSGEVYLKDNELVWIFKEIDGRTYLGKDVFTLDSEDWRIEEKAGMSVRKNKSAQVMKVVRDLDVAPEVTTVAVAEAQPQQLPAQAPPQAVSRQVRPPVVAPPAPTAEVISPGLEELEKKLETLKKWQGAGLITDEDYEKQKAQILERLQQL
jgi:hypothetical protein